MAQVSCYEVIGAGFLGAFEKDVVSGVGRNSAILDEVEKLELQGPTDAQLGTRQH